MIKNLQFHWIKNSSTVANRHYIRSNIVKATIIITFNFIGSGTKIMFSRFERDPNRTLLFHTAKERRDNSNLQFRWIRNSKIIYIYIRTPTESLHLLTVGEIISRWREKIWQTSSDLMAQDLISWPTNALRVCYQTHFHREMNRVSRPNWLFAQQQWGNVTAAWHYVNGQWLLIMTRDHFHSRSAANCEPLPPTSWLLIVPLNFSLFKCLQTVRLFFD